MSRTCSTHTYNSYRGGTSYSYEACTNTASAYILPIIVVSPLLVLAYLYMRAKIPHPWRRAIAATAVIGIGTAIEFFAGAFLILSSAGVLYLISIPFFWALAHKIYSSTSLSKPLSR
ncbi:hypothetical protein KC992_01770 [Candidatus Saccharibacteria bacterium]|nr:hypothetical protein [Candidatus Saccharibacteria bacterium]